MSNNFKGTAGEWEIKDKTCIFVKGNKLAIVCVQNNYEQITFKPIEDVEAIANAKVMVKAPELLKTLEIFINNYRYGRIEDEFLTKVDKLIKESYGD